MPFSIIRVKWFVAVHMVSKMIERIDLSTKKKMLDMVSIALRAEL